MAEKFICKRANFGPVTIDTASQRCLRLASYEQITTAGKEGAHWQLLLRI